MESGSEIDPGSQPHQHPAESLSQPLFEEAKSLLTKARRSVTSRDYEEVVRYSEVTVGKLPDKTFETLESLRSAVFEVIVQRLKYRGVTSPSLQEKSFSWCLPTS